MLIQIFTTLAHRWNSNNDSPFTMEKRVKLITGRMLQLHENALHDVHYRRGNKSPVVLWVWSIIAHTVVPVLSYVIFIQYILSAFHLLVRLGDKRLGILVHVLRPSHSPIIYN